MITAVRNLFLNHPHKVDEGYFEHMAFAARFGGTLTLAAGAALVHAVLPFAFERTASRMVAQLHARAHNRSR